MPPRPPTARDDAIQADWYDFPHWYDILHTPGTAAEVRGLKRIAARFTPGVSAHRAPTWIEPACGSGRYLRAALARGIRVVGIDANAAMIEYARARMARAVAARRAFLRVGDIADFSLPASWRCDLAFCLINTVRHLPGDRAMLDHLACVARILKPGAVYALGLSLTRYGHEFASEDVWKAARGPCRVHQLVSYLPPGADRREKVISHLSITTPTRRHHLDSSYDLRAYSGREWKRLLDRSAMTPVAVVDEMGDDLRCRTGEWFSDRASGYGVFILRPRM